MSKSALKFRLEPTQEQKKWLRQSFGNRRFIYNHMLAEKSALYADGRQKVTCIEQIRELPALKKEYEWLAVSETSTLQNAVRDLYSAYDRFFKGQAGYPKFRKRRDRQTIRMNNNHHRKDIRCEGNRIHLPKIGWVKCRFSKEIHGEITSATISMDPDGRFCISLALETADPAPAAKTGESVGIDPGVKDLAITSDGKKYANPKYLRKAQKKLKKAQRKLSRKAKGSKNREKQRLRVAKIHQKIKNQRLDGIHKMTREIVDEYDMIGIEDLNAKGMMKNHHLAKSVADASFHEIRRQLEYKAAWAGKTVQCVDRFFPSSQMCSVCGHIAPYVKNLSVRRWQCCVCGADHDRDINAAKNIRDEALRLLAVP